MGWTVPSVTDGGGAKRTKQTKQIQLKPNKLYSSATSDDVTFLKNQNVPMRELSREFLGFCCQVFHLPQEVVSLFKGIAHTFEFR